MLELSCYIDPNLIDAIECYGIEYDGLSPWALMRHKPEDDYKLNGYFSNQDELESAWAALKTEINGLPEYKTIKQIDDHDWKERYKDFLDVWEYEGLAWVPGWKRDEYQVVDNGVRVLFDAGMAFGTGDHPTTQFCAKRLIEFGMNYSEIYHETNIIDAGCGSGILAVTARMLGCANVYGFDIDPDAIQVSKENLTLNDLPEDAVEFQVAGIDSGLKNRKADLIMANIQADILNLHASDFVQALTPGGILVLSGILEYEKLDCEQQFLISFKSAGVNVKTIASRSSGDWADLCFLTS